MVFYQKTEPMAASRLTYFGEGPLDGGKIVQLSEVKQGTLRLHQRGFIGL
jgi:hypothetical protein